MAGRQLACCFGTGCVAKEKETTAGETQKAEANSHGSSRASGVQHILISELVGNKKKQMMVVVVVLLKVAMHGHRG